jgi:phosphoglycolate phosphatase-like HAD superfamily hydrolase
MGKEIVIFDIDGTLSDVSERIHHLQRKPKD